MRVHFSVHGFAFLVKTVALGAAFASACALAVAATAAPSATFTTALGATLSTSAFAASFRAGFATAGVAAGATALAATSATSTVTAAFTVATAFAALFGLGHRCGYHGRRSAGGCREQAFDPAHQACGCGRCRSRHRCGRFGCHGSGLGCFDLDRRLGRGCVGQHALDDGRLFVGWLLRAAGHAGGLFHVVGHFVAGFDVVQARVVVLQTLELVVGRFECLVGHHQHVDALLELNLGDLGTLFVQQERSHVHRHLAQHRGRVVLERLFLDDAQNLQRARFGVTDVAGTAATRAGDGCTLT